VAGREKRVSKQRISFANLPQRFLSVAASEEVSLQLAAQLPRRLCNVI
jgi:hypothetical protein